MLKEKLAAALKDNCRASATLTRSLSMINRIDLTGNTFSFFDDQLDDRQIQRIRDVYYKAEAIELTRPATRTMKAGYRLTAKFLPPVQEIHESRFEEIDADIAEWENTPCCDIAGECECDCFLKCCSDTIVEDDWTPDWEAIKEWKREEAEHEAKLQKMVDDREALLKKLSTRSKSARNIIANLQYGPRTRAALLQAATSASSLDRTLRQMKELGLITVEGARRSNMIYSLVK